MLFTNEAKGTSDWLKGMAQAEVYRQGFHAAILAVAGSPSTDVQAFARQRGIGMLAVHPLHVEVVEPPPLHLSKFQLARSFDTTRLHARAAVAFALAEAGGATGSDTDDPMT